MTAGLERISGSGSGGAPIAHVAGDAAATGALAELAREIESARAEGRMVLTLPLAAIDAGHLVRDRIRLDAEEMSALTTSLAMRGQQTPVEVVELLPGAGGGNGLRFGLISGWRRLAALRQLHEDTGEDRFSTITALLRRPESAGAAYVSMVEENEIRAPLGHWERAEIVAGTVESGVFADREAALSALFGAVSRSRRSKIRSFLALRDALAGVLAFPFDLSERAGLALAGVLATDQDFAERLGAALKANPPADAAAERSTIEQVLRKGDRPSTERRSAGSSTIASRDVQLSVSRNRAVLRGPGVDNAFCTALARWLEARNRQVGSRSGGVKFPE